MIDAAVPAWLAWGMTVAAPSQPVPAFTRAGDRHLRPSPWAVLLQPMRVMLLVVLVVGPGVAAHRLVDGVAPHPRLVVVGAFLVGVLGCLVGHRRLGRAAAAVLLLAGQAVLHVVLSLCHLDPASSVGAVVHRWICPGDVTPSSWQADPWRIMTLRGLPAGVTDAGPIHTGRTGADGFVAHLLPSPAMIAGHLLAAAVLGWWLARGETAVLAAVDQACARAAAVPRLLTGVLLHVPARTARVAVDAGPVLNGFGRVAAAHRRRGPPVVLA